jgi:MoxR-like ATPase
LAGRYSLAFDDIRSVAKQALRHRILLTFDAQRQGTTPESIIESVLEAVPENIQRAVR